MVHDVIQEALERNSGTGHPINSGELQARARTRLRRGWIQSTSREWQANKKSLNLFELFHGDGKSLPKEDTEKVKNKVYSALHNFAESTILKEILSVPPFHWKPVDALGSYMLDDIKVWVAIDFAYNDPTGHLHIIDWKTGKENTDELFLQLAGYAFYANNQWGAPIDKIKMCGVYLNEHARVSHYTVTEEQVLQARDHILTSSREMYSLLDDVQTNKASEDRFAPEPVEWRCRNCNFKTICPAMKDQCTSILDMHF